MSNALLLNVFIAAMALLSACTSSKDGGSTGSGGQVGGTGGATTNGATGGSAAAGAGGTSVGTGGALGAALFTWGTSLVKVDWPSFTCKSTATLTPWAARRCMAPKTMRAPRE